MLPEPAISSQSIWPTARRRCWLSKLRCCAPPSNTRKHAIRSRSTQSRCCRITCTRSGYCPPAMDFAMRWRLIKTTFSRGLPHGEPRSASREARGERGIWQRRYWEHLIRDDEDFARHADYIHINPVKHGHVKQAAEWPHSSFHRYVRAGILPLDWAGCATEEMDCGERNGD